MQNNTNNYNNHHGDYFLTMSLRINTEMQNTNQNVPGEMSISHNLTTS